MCMHSSVIFKGTPAKANCLVALEFLIGLKKIEVLLHLPAFLLGLQSVICQRQPARHQLGSH